MFQLHQQLREDTFHVGDFELSMLLMNRDANYPWFILVPMRAGVSEPMALCRGDQLLLLEESMVLGEVLMAEFQGDKLNIAALGNMVPQLHVHHVVRFRGDPVWPKPVWGQLPAKVENEAFYRSRIDAVATRLDGRLKTPVL